MNPTAKPKKKIGKLLMYGTLTLVGIIFLSNLIYKMSGSNQWELEMEKNGVKIYTLKSPGSTITKVKGVVRWNKTLSEIMAPYLDEGIQENCGEWMPGCTEYKFVESFDPKLQRSITLTRFDFPFPFSPRELVLQGQITQDEQTKVLTMDNIAIPNAIPPKDGYVRVTHHANKWTLTPQENGEVIVEFIVDADMGGFFPDFLSAIAGPNMVYEALAKLYPPLLEKYENAKIDFIEELGESPAKAMTSLNH